MKKTALILLALLLLLCPLCAGCTISAKTAEPAAHAPESAAASESEEEAEPEKDAEPAPESVSSSEAKPKPEPEPEPEPKPVNREHIDLATSNIIHGGDFCEGLTWIKYRLPGDSSTTVTALVDKSGSVYYKTTERVIYAAPVSEGYTFLRIRTQQTGTGSRLNENDYCEIVIDAEGAECFRTEQNETANGYHGDHSLCSGGGYFAVKSSEGVLGLYNLSGNLVKALGDKPRVFSITDEYLAYGSSDEVKYLFFNTLA